MGDEYNRILIKLFGELIELFEKIKGKSLSDFVMLLGWYREKFEMKFEKLWMSLEVMMDMFKLVVDSILCYVEELVLDFVIKGLKNIILVGGFLDCKII